MAQFEIPDTEIQGMLATRIMDSLSAETKEKLIAEALKFLTTKPSSRNYYATNNTPLEDAFDRALTKLANQLADEVVAESPVAQQVRDQLKDLLNGVPDLQTDYGLQQRFMQAILDRAAEIKRGE